MAGLHFDITGDNSNFLRKLDEARNGIRSTSKQIEESGMSIEQMFGRLAKGAAAFGAGITAKEIVSNIVRIRGEFQQLEVAFNTMLGSEQKAGSLMQQLVKTAATTPFDLQSVANGAKQLLAYGTAAEDVNGTLIRLGDIAAGLSIPLGDLVYLYGTTMSQGRLYTQDLNQFTGRGIPMIGELAKQFGVAESEVKKLVESGKVGFPEVQKVIERLTNEGGKFGGLMEAQSKTITGQISNIEDSISTMYNNLGKQSEGVINDALSGVSYLVENYEQVGKTVLELAATYGAYKAVLMSVAAHQSVAIGITYASEIAELSKLIPLKKQSANEDVIAAVASGKLSQAKAEQVISIRAEIAAKLQSLQATEAQTVSEHASAMSAYKSATQRMLIAKQNMALAQSQMLIAIKSGTVDEIATAKKNAQTASLELNNAAIAKNSTHKTLNIAATNKKAAADAVSSFQIGVNTSSQVANTTSTNILTIAKTRLAAASKALGLSMLANPYVLTTAAIVGLGYGIYKLITYQTDAEKAQLKLNDSIKEAEKASLLEHRELSKLKGELSGLTKGTDEYNIVKDKIIKGFGKYYSGLDTEIEKVGLTEQAYNKLTEAINKSFGARQYEKFASEQQEELSNTMSENLGNIQDRLLKELGNEYGSKIYAKIRDGVMRGSLSLGKSAFDIKGLDSETKLALDKAAGKDGGLFDITNRSIEGYISNIIVANKATEELDKKARERFGVEGSSDKSTNTTTVNDVETKTASEWLSHYKKTYEEADKAYNDFLKSKQVMSEADRDKELERLKGLRDTAKATYEAKGGSASSDTKQESAAEKLREQQEKLKSLQGKQSKDNIRQAKDLEFEAVQAKISAMQEGSEKSIAQMNLDHQKEIETLKRNRQDYLQKKIEAERAIFEADPSNKGKSFDSSTVSLSKDEESMFNNLLESTISQQGNELATYYKEILAKYQGYAEKRLAAQKKFQQERDALVKAGASKEAIAENDYQRDETFKSIDNEFAMREDSFKAWADNIADLSLEKLRVLLVQAERELERSEFLNPNDPKLAGQRAKVTSLKNTISAKTAETNTSPNKRSQKEWQDLHRTLSNVEKDFDDIGDAVGGTAGEIISAAGGIASSTLQMIDGIVMLANGSSQAMSGTAQAASKSIQAVEKASVILAIIGAALQIATKIASMFSADYSDYNKAKENYENYVEVLDTVIGKQKELMETMTGKAAVEASQKALELIEKQADAARILGKERLNAGASAGSHSIGVRIRKGMSSEGWNEAKKALGSDFYNKNISDGRMTGLFDLSVEQLEKLQMEAPTFWAKLDGDVREYLEQIIACNEKTEEMKDLLNEALTQVSFDDVYSNFLDALSDMDTSSEEFANNFEEYMQKAILNSMLIDNYKSRIDAWYKAFAKANDDNAGVTEEEYKDLQKEWNDLVSDALSERDKLKDLFGWTGDDSTSQSSTKGGFETMSQDTGTELNGRFTALQVSSEEIKNSMLSMLSGVNLISTSTTANGITLMEIRNLAISSNSHLEDIARFTKPLLEVGGKLDRIESNTKGLTKR